MLRGSEPKEADQGVRDVIRGTQVVDISRAAAFMTEWFVAGLVLFGRSPVFFSGKNRQNLRWALNGGLTQSNSALCIENPEQACQASINALRNFALS